jgi:catechol-2,3-dioxygenase
VCRSPEFFHRKEQIMIDHISIGVRDIARTKRFYDAALKPLGYTCLSEGQGSLGYGKEAVTLWISSTERPVPAEIGVALLLGRPDAAQH